VYNSILANYNAKLAKFTLQVNNLLWRCKKKEWNFSFTPSLFKAIWL